MRPADLAALVSLAVIWGTNFLFVEAALDGTSPAVIVLVRLALGGLLIVLVARLRRVSLPPRAATWARVAGMGLIGQALPFLLFAFGQQEVTSALAGVYTGATPLLTIPVVWLLLRKRPSPGEAVASMVGFVGLAIVLAPWSGTGGSYRGQLLCLGGALCYALGYAYAANLLASVTDDKFSLAAAQALTGAGLMLPVAVATGGGFDLRVGVTVALVLLGIATAAAFVINYWLIARVGPVQASLAFYLIPVVAVVAGLVIGGETLTANQILGSAVVLCALGILYLWNDLASARRRVDASSAGGDAGGSASDAVDAAPSARRSVSAPERARRHASS